MTLKKILISVFAVMLSSAAFAFPTPPDDTDPLAEAMEQYTAQMEELNKTFDEKVLPPLKGLLEIERQFGESMQEYLFPEQQEEFDKYETALTKAFTDIVTPIAEQADMEQVNEMFKMFFIFVGQTPHEITRQQFFRILMVATKKDALDHFQETQKLTEEEIRLARFLLFFPQEEDEDSKE